MPLCVHAQTAADWWYFGNRAGIHFETSGPVADTNGRLVTSEGCASISDGLGNLLMYTDGDSVWNANHVTMPNGFDLRGNSSSTQSAIIVPRPGNPSEYYVVTVPVFDTVGLRYSLVDMNLEGGLGDVVSTEKNVLIRRRIREKVAAVQHSNGIDYWIVSQPMQSDTVFAFLITSAGVNTTPVVSLTGNVSPNFSGYLKGSSGGGLLASGHEMGLIQLMEFNNATGDVTNEVSWNTTMNAGYGVEFSPNEQLLYTAPRSSSFSSVIYQYDISSFDSALIVASEYEVVDSLGTGALQLGPDQKIYVAKTSSLNGYLSSIEFPNVQGAGCTYVDSAVFLQGRFSTQGLPPFVSALVVNTIDVRNNCFNDSIFFSTDTTGQDSAMWVFGDPAAGAADTALGFEAAHVYSDTGTFLVTLFVTRDTITDTLFRSIIIFPRQVADLGNDTAICTGESVELNVDQPFATYLWNNGSTDSAQVYNSDTTVMVTVFGVCDTVSDTIQITIDNGFTMQLPEDTLVCDQPQFSIIPSITGSPSYLWIGGNTTGTLTVDTTGQYVLAAFNTCDTTLDTIEVTFLPTPVVELPDDTINCSSSIVRLTRPANDSINYTWSDSSTALTFDVDSTQTVWLSGENACGISTDTINIFQVDNILVNLGPDTQLCPGDTILLGATWMNATYLWSTGETTDSIWTNTIEDVYTVTVTVDSCSATDRINIQFTEVACPNIDCSVRYDNVFTPNGDGWNDRFRLRSDCEIQSFDLRIYSRWGQLVHQSSQIGNGWDGFIVGEPASEGVYYFILEYRDQVVVDADREVVQGSFTLIR